MAYVIPYPNVPWHILFLYKKGCQGTTKKWNKVYTLEIKVGTNRYEKG